MSNRISIETLRNSYNDKVLYISKEYFSLDELKNVAYIREDFSDELLSKIWNNYDFKKAEKRLFELQCKLTKATFAKKQNNVKHLQNKIVYSSEAKMLAVRKVADISKSCAGVDGIVWRKDSDKMRAAILLNNMEYKAKPLKYFVFKDTKTGKERSVGSPTVFDRAMQVLYSYALEPIAEARADRKSFAFRKGRSARTSTRIYYGLLYRYRLNRMGFNNRYKIVL